MVGSRFARKDCDVQPKPFGETAYLYMMRVLDTPLFVSGMQSNSVARAISETIIVGDVLLSATTLINHRLRLQALLEAAQIMPVPYAANTAYSRTRPR